MSAKLSGSKSMGIQLLTLMIDDKYRTVDQLKRIFGANDSDPFIVKLLNEIEDHKISLNWLRAQPIDNINLFV